MNKKIIAITLTLDALLIAIFCHNIEVFGTTNLDLSWTLSSILPKFLVLNLSVLGSWLLYTIYKKTWFWSIPIICSLIAFISSPIYQGDYNKQGNANNTIKNNLIIERIKKENPKYNGLLAIVSATFPYCIDAVNRLKIMHKRSPDLDLSFTMHSQDSLQILRFKEKTNTINDTYYHTDNLTTIGMLSQGSFPYFIYIKNGKIIHRWNNEQLGYRALDWIEQGL